MSGVREWYAAKGVLVTGATGFVGLALVEKLLRVVPDGGPIYLLVRPKKGKSPEQRLHELLNNQVFERVKSESGDTALSRVKAVSGDVEEEELGLSLADRAQLASQVEVVIHSAASLDFEASLTSTVRTNLEGTRRVIRLAKLLPNLKALVHVSSAYVNANRTSAEERLYPVHLEAESLLNHVNSLSEEALDQMTPTLLGDHPNSYTLTKALAEHEMAAAFDSGLPAAIVRPSMIVAAWREPVPGWTVSKNGPQGFLMGASKGVVRRLPMDVNLVCDYIPVDLVINGLLVAGYHVANHRPKEIPVVHVTSSTTKPFRWRTVLDDIHPILHKYPLKSAVWYPRLKLLPSVLMFQISAVIFHFLPAYLLDGLTFLFGGRPILVRLHKNIMRSINVLRPFIFAEWKFDNSQALNIQKALPPEDQQVFNMNVSDINWTLFFENMTQGVRTYLNREHPSSLPFARKKDKVLGVLNLLVQGLVIWGLWFLLATLTSTTFTQNFWTIPIIYLLFAQL